jgi:autotransporter-associated beta strand protein
MIFAGNVTLPTGITGTGGTIQVGNGGAGTLTFNAPVNTTGDVVFNSAGATTASQAITAGNLTFNSGTTTTGNINVKNLTVNGAAATTLNGTLQASSGLLFSSTGTSTVNGVISGAASVTQAGSGTVTLVANNTYTGTTTVNAGSTLQVGNNTPTGTLGSGAVTNNGNLIFNNSGAKPQQQHQRLGQPEQDGRRPALCLRQPDLHRHDHDQRDLDDVPGRLIAVGYVAGH